MREARGLERLLARCQACTATPRAAPQPSDDAATGDPPHPVPMSAARQRLGILGERVAARWLRRAGWRIVAHRFRNGRRDLDLVAERGGTVAFVEVKARRGDGFGGPVEAVTWRKQRELTRSANVWIDRFGATGQNYRFDVVGVLFTPDSVRVRHVEDAFPVSRPS